MRDQFAWLTCTHPGCEKGTTIVAAHLANVTAGGGWDCTEHQEDDQ